jgi:hypothetical protein
MMTNQTHTGKNYNRKKDVKHTTSGAPDNPSLTTSGEGKSDAMSSHMGEKTEELKSQGNESRPLSLSMEEETLFPATASLVRNSTLDKEGNKPPKKDETPNTEPEEENSTKSASAREEHRQEKQSEKLANGHWFTRQWKDDVRKVQLCRPGPGFSMSDWNTMVCHWALAPHEEGPGNTMEKARRMPIPDGFNTRDWWYFLLLAEDELAESAPSMTDTLGKVEAILGMPRQNNKTSLMAGK